MHVALTDRLVCPRCGPEFGLILLAHDIRDRRVLEGELGCPGCEGRYPVRGGLGDLRASPDGSISLGQSDPPLELDREEEVRLGALLGVTEGPGTLLIKGPVARLGRALSERIGQVEIVGVDPSLVELEEETGLSRLLFGRPFPFFPGSFRGVILSGDMDPEELREAARVVAPPGRVVVLGGPPEAKERLLALGMSVLLEEDGVLVARREISESLPLVTLRGP